MNISSPAFILYLSPIVSIVSYCLRFYSILGTIFYNSTTRKHSIWRPALKNAREIRQEISIERWQWHGFENMNLNYGTTLSYSQLFYRIAAVKSLSQSCWKFIEKLSAIYSFFKKGIGGGYFSVSSRDHIAP